MAIKIILLLICVVIIHAHTSDNHYHIIIDAGSTGSRLYLFQYILQHHYPIINVISTTKNYGGLSNVGSNNAGISLKQLLDNAQAEILRRNLNNITIDVLGTAGMRLLSSTEQESIYNDIKSYIQEHYTFHIGRVMTISGEMEGIYGWLEINYLRHTLISNHKIVKGFYDKLDVELDVGSNDELYVGLNDELDVELPVGVVDVGGASVQITFANNVVPNMYFNNILNDHAYHNLSYVVNHTDSLITKSLLGKGLRSTRLSMNKHHLAHTCYPSNDTNSFDFDVCKSLYINILRDVKSLFSVGEQHFIVIGAAYTTYHFFDILDGNDRQHVQQHIKHICNEWKIDDHMIKKVYPYTSEIDYCADAVYFDTLLYDVFGMQFDNISIINSINGRDVNWVTGALFYEIASGTM